MPARRNAGSHILGAILVAALSCACASTGDRDRQSPEQPAAGQPLTDYDFHKHAERVRARIERIASDQPFHVVVERPFVVIGDQPPRDVERWAQRTVRWSVQSLQKAYFASQPDHIIEIWLFGDEHSYVRNARRFFGDNPSTPFGYYSPTHRALVMNIATGGGTLVHEIVHPFMRANFPACPAWFNEGMGSLYEQSARRDGDIIGLTNWRLEGLQNALRTDSVPTFAALTGTTEVQFYDRDPGTNYAQARYLLYYLQEKGLLRAYYRRFVANAERDPTGYDTLQEVLGQDDMTAFFRTWRDFVLALEFP